MQPKYDALYRALVTSTVDTAGLNRIRVQCPQIGATVEIRQAEPANPQEPVPPVGSTVWIAFSGGDITKPIYFTNQAVPATVTSTTLPATPYPGELAFADDINELEIYDGSAWQSVYAPWYSYTPTWSGLSALGTGYTTQGYYQISGRTVTANAMLIGGTSTSLGTGTISFSLPFAASSIPNANFGWTGAGRFNPAGGNAWHPTWSWVGTGGSSGTVFALRSTDLAWVSPGTAGFSWIAGSVMNSSITYQI